MSRVQTRNDDERKQAARRAKAEYEREWRKRNPGKQAEYSLRYWMRKAEQAQAETQTGGQRADEV